MSSTAAISAASLNTPPQNGQLEPVYQVKLLAALRSGDPALIHPFLTEISKDRRASDVQNCAINPAAAALHLAVRCASSQTVTLLLSHRAISPNGVHPSGSGITPLHLAATLGRADIVALLLEQDGIDDTIRDSQGRTCRDVARGRDVVKAIDDSRSFLNASFRSLLRSYVLSPLSESPSTTLLLLLESPRAAWVDLSYLDDSSGSSVLHEAAKRKDLRLIELAVRAGADVFVRNRRGKTALETAGKDDKVRVFLRQFANHDKSLIQPTIPMSEPPVLRGYLNKYTNVAKGYNTRWFVLAHGVLSYYRHQDDESITSRGSIAMKNAHLKVPSRTTHSRSSSGVRFEIHSLPTNNSSSQEKWYIRANHPTEASRWIQAIKTSIEWYKRDPRPSTPDPGSSAGGGITAAAAEMNRRQSGESGSDSRSMYSYSNTVVKRPPVISRTPTLPGASMNLNNLTSSLGTTNPGGDTDSIHVPLTGDPNLSDTGAGGRDDEGDDIDDIETSSADTGARHKGPPHEASIDLTRNSVAMQLEATQALLKAFLGSLPPSVFGTSSSSSAAASTQQFQAVPMIGVSSSRSVTSTSVKSSITTSTTSSASSNQSNLSSTKDTLLTSLSTLSNLMTEWTKMTTDRETHFKKQLAMERARQNVWEESLAMVVKEGAVLEEELRTRSRRRGSKIFGAGEPVYVAGDAAGGGRRRFSQGRYSTIRSSALKPVLVTTADLPEETVVLEQQEGKRVLERPVVESPPQEFVQPVDAKLESTAQKRQSSLKVARFVQPRVDSQAYSSGDSDAEDEFFDAIDSNNLPNLIIPPPLSSPSQSPAHLPPYIFTLPYSSYSVIREKLETADERPPTSLWSVLKHSIGKDLTRISFPVFFNEPTSMLQRMAEDMEFSECLDTAATQRDSLKRLAFVAAFAMSNYSSTIGRIAKPFNPMLSETFEYVRLDKKYRYVSEQVSHHPPISACWAESPLWHYFGEVDAQNKFMGKSFEIRPTGVAHAELIIPESWVEDTSGSRGTKQYPKAKGALGQGKVVEHYTWKKVTTNVSGFILGNPTIDHYGDMIITNHRTNERCTLTFKPRGWRGKDSYEISGQVLDSRGRVVYEIAGRWNSQLIMREVGQGPYEGALNPDATVHSHDTLLSPGASTPTLLNNSGLHAPNAISSTRSSPGPIRDFDQGPAYLLLWKNSVKPPSPFNLTPYAISLNHLPSSAVTADPLKPYLPPTDCRLRPDQRAFELGKYDLANDLKLLQEEKQRATRKARENGMKEGHKPRWFVSGTCGDTGERVWVPKRVRVKMWIDAEDGNGDNYVNGGQNGNKEGGGVVDEERVEYWAERERVWREKQPGGGDGEGMWVDVEEIFIEEPQEIRQPI